MFERKPELDCALDLETQYHDESSTEYVDQHHTTNSAHSCLLRIVLRTLWYIYVAMTTAVTLHFAFSTYPKSHSDVINTPDDRNGLLGLGEDPLGFVPQFSTTPIMFWNSSKYSYIESAGGKADLAVQEAWTQLQPETSSHIDIDELNSLDFPTPLHDPETGDDYLGIAVFHQLHCLHRIARGFTLLYRGEPFEDALSHTEHCIEYLRVVIMCHADTTLEGGEFVDSAHVAQGMGTTHTCKDWDKVLSWTKKHAISN